MSKSYTALLVVILISALLTGCQNDLSNEALVQPTSSAARSDTSPNTIAVDTHQSDVLVEEALQLQEDLDGFAKDIEDLENLGGDIASQIDRELDGF